jgi:hypothetical protein
MACTGRLRRGWGVWREALARQREAEARREEEMMGDAVRVEREFALRRGVAALRTVVCRHRAVESKVKTWAARIRTHAVFTWWYNNTQDALFHRHARLQTVLPVAIRMGDRCRARFAFRLLRRRVGEHRHAREAKARAEEEAEELRAEKEALMAKLRGWVSEGAEGSGVAEVDADTSAKDMTTATASSQSLLSASPRFTLDLPPPPSRYGGLLADSGRHILSRVSIADSTEDTLPEAPQRSRPVVDYDAILRSLVDDSADPPESTQQAIHHDPRVSHVRRTRADEEFAAGVSRMGSSPSAKTRR